MSEAIPGVGQIPTIRCEAMRESVRCIQTSTEVYFEFWLPEHPKTRSRMHADSLLRLLTSLREYPVDDDIFYSPLTLRVDEWEPET